jgi:hypothetical protein
MFDGSSGEKICPQRDALNTSAGALWRPELREVSLDNMGSISAAQHGFSRHSAKEAADALFVFFNADIVKGRKARARLLSCARRPASAWLDTLPLRQALELKSGEVQAGL